MAARLTAYLVVSIVVATVIAGLIVGAQRSDGDGPVDLIVRNAVVYTADGSGDTAEAVAIRGNQILRVGSNREIARLERPQTIVIDARGGAVLPGFNDAHVDLIQGGLAAASLNLAGAETASELLDRVAVWRNANPTARWIVGRGWSPLPVTKGQVPRQLLDSIVKDRPVLLYGTTRDSAWVNSKALQIGNIGRKTADPANGVIVRESQRGEPTGALRGSAVQLVEQVLPLPTREERIAAVRTAVAEANAVGITSVQTAGDTREALELYDTVRKAGELTVRVYSTLKVDEPLSETELPALDDVRKAYPDDPLLKAGAISISLDGEIAARKAALLEPYEDDPDLSVSSFDADQLNRTARLLDAAGWQLIAHAAGDRAVRMALGALAHAVRSNRAPAGGRRHRIEHLGLIDDADLPRFGPLGIIGSMQPTRGVPAPPRMDLLARHLGEERAARTFAFRSVDEETRLVFGSGWPGNDLNPLRGIHVAVNQQTPDGLPEKPWHPTQRLTLTAAIDAYTSTAAWASFDEERKGTLSAGMLADLVVLDQDIFAIPPATLSAASVAATIFDGKIVYRRATSVTRASDALEPREPPSPGALRRSSRSGARAATASEASSLQY